MIDLSLTGDKTVVFQSDTNPQPEQVSPFFKIGDFEGRYFDQARHLHHIDKFRGAEPQQTFTEKTDMNGEQS